MRYARALLAVGTMSVLLVTGCSGDDSAPSASSGPTASTSVVTPSDPGPAASSAVADTATETTSREPIPSGTLPAEQEASDGARLTVTGARVGEHDGFDRVVFDLAGTGTPGWIVRFTDDPRRDGSGEPVSIDGKSVIQVIITGVGNPGDTGVDPFVGEIAGNGGITEVDVAGPFEGQAAAFIGSEAENPAVRVSTLSSPTRLVVDIAR